MLLLPAVLVSLLLALGTALVLERRKRIRAESLRRDERTGRIRAEQRLRQQQTTTTTPPGGAEQTAQMFSCRRIGEVRSVFRQRFGTPRQPRLCGSSRAVLRLDAPALEGLDQFSHAWVFFVFNLNTNSPASTGATAKTKIRAPRLEGGSMGVFATRSPHHPAPIGLSLCRVVSVRGGELTLSGLDVVDGTTVLDVKPYVHYSDSVDPSLEEIRTAGWVAEPERILEVAVPPACRASLETVFARRRKESLLDSPDHAERLIKEVLCRDIRSQHHKEVSTPETNLTVALDVFLVTFTVDLGAPPPQVCITEIAEGR